MAPGDVMIAPKVPKRPGSEAVSQATRAKRKRATQFADQADLCRMLPCCACRPLTRRIVRGVLIGKSVGWYGPESRVSDPHHFKTRAAGGTDEHCVPLCRRHHRELDAPNSGPETFQAKHAVDFEATAAMISEAVRREQGAA